MNIINEIGDTVRGQEMLGRTAERAHQRAQRTSGADKQIHEKTEWDAYQTSAGNSRKHLDGETPVVGVSIGITKNMDNYESLRADVWLTDKKQDNETLEEAYSRVAKITSEVLQEIVGEYV